MPEEWGALSEDLQEKRKSSHDIQQVSQKKMTMKEWIFQKMKCLLLFDTNKHEEQVIYKEMQPRR
jgi:hypothetical protein